jgi:phage replication initiation protein
VSPEEKLVLEGGQVKFLTQKRQVANASQAGVIVDYLRFTVNEMFLRGDMLPDDTDASNLARLMALHFATLLGFTLGEDRPGRDYYDHTTTINNANGYEVASVSAGGEGQRGSVCFTLKGEGCTNAMPGWEQRVFSAFNPLHPKVTRIDLARDFYDGEVTVEQMVAAYRDHAFSYQNRKPKCNNIGDWENGNSRTFQVGKRESGKLCRGYEKDHQFGIMDGKWFRVEAELRAVNRVIPWDALVNTAQYFAGAYEFCHWVCNHEAAVRIPTATKVAANGVQAAVNWLRRVVAPTLVQIAGHMPDFDWLEDLVLAERHRPMPKSLRGFQPHNVKQGLLDAFAFMSTNAREPVAGVI